MNEAYELSAKRTTLQVEADHEPALREAVDHLIADLQSVPLEDLSGIGFQRRAALRVELANRLNDLDGCERRNR